MLQQMRLFDLFDPITLFDLSFYFSELDGVGRKYVRFVTFKRIHILPFAETDTEVFYDTGSSRSKPSKAILAEQRPSR